MSVVGCFGDCGFKSDGEPVRQKEYRLKFYPPIQTVLKEKDTQKWYTDMVNELATLGDNPNQLNEFGEAPLCVAANKGQGLVVDELLQKENIRVNIKGKHGRTPLYLAAEEGHVFIVKVLLNHPDIDVNCKNAPGDATALMGASRKGHSRIVELILQHPRCDPEQADRDGNTALHHARTSSVKRKLHQFTYRSRSLETVIQERARTTNLCHVSSPESDSMESSPDNPFDLEDEISEAFHNPIYRSLEDFAPPGAFSSGTHSPGPEFSPPGAYPSGQSAPGTYHSGRSAARRDTTTSSSGCSTSRQSSTTSSQLVLIPKDTEETKGLENLVLRATSVDNSLHKQGCGREGGLRRPLLTLSRPGSSCLQRPRIASNPATEAELEAVVDK